MKKIIIEQDERFKALIEDIKAILTEGIFNYRWTLIKTYHLIGCRILEEKDNFSKADITTHVSQAIGRSDRTIERAVRFAEKYPDLDNLPDGKNISWHAICEKYLPDKKEEHICDFEEIIIRKCKLCGKKIGTMN